MAKKPSGGDFAQHALRIVEIATEAPLNRGEKRNPAAVALGRLGGLKGGKARARKLTGEERSEIARKAALKRWENRADKMETGG